MAYSITKQSGKETYGVTEYIVNNASEVATVPTDAASGSTILDINTGDVYMLKVMSSGVKTWGKIGG